MKTAFRILAAAAAALALSACETTAPSQQPEPVDPKPPVVNNQGQAAPQRPAPAAAGQQNTQQQVVITVHLAQAKAEPTLVAVDAGGEAPLYALPQPVLTQQDMGRVSPVTAQDGRSFLLLEMNQNGIPKLKNVTEKARGHYLLLSVGGQLVSVSQITEPILDGRLLVSTQGPEHSRAILRMMRGS